MIKNYLKTAIRNLKRNKTYTVLNILGLTVGIAACMLLFCIVRFEKSFDNFHANKDRIFRLGSEYHNEDGISQSVGVPFPTEAALKTDFPAIKKVAAAYDYGGAIISIPGDAAGQAKKFNEPRVYFVEKEFYDIFNFPWLAGDPNLAMTKPGNVALTRKIAEKYFGDYRSAMGKMIKFDNRLPYQVAGIIDDLPANTDFPIHIAISFPSLWQTGMERNRDDWVSTFGGHELFVVLPDNYSNAAFNKDLAAFTKKHKPAEYVKDQIVSQPLATIHTDERFGNYNNGRTFSNQLGMALSLIGVFLIVIGCVNFINLATAKAVTRSKEVGVRKVMGSSRSQLAAQFLSETAVITIVAVIGAGILATAVLPLLNNLLEVEMRLRILSDPLWLMFLLGAAIAVVLFSGLYPAFIISGFNPVTALKNKINSRMVGGISLRRVLVVFQFAIAHILIIGTIVVVSQTDFFRRASLGFSTSSIINVFVPGDSISTTKYTGLKSDILKIAGVEKVSVSFASPSDNGGWQSDFKFDHSPKNTNFNANLKWADADYFSTYDLKFVAGKPYSQSDTIRGFVVNQTLLKRLGITDPQQAIGKQIDFWDGRKVSEIVGVISDFNSYSLREPMAPVILGCWQNTYQLLNIRIQPGKEKSVITATEKLWTAAYPDNVFDYQFLDKKIEAFYRQENQLARLYKLFAGLAIFISCLGLYGLISFIVVQRTREVGVRKVLGATTANILYLLSREFTLLIILAFALAAPVAWYLMNGWLENFTYRITPGVGIFLTAICGSVLIAWISVGYRAIRAALVNPVQSLKTE